MLDTNVIPTWITGLEEEDLHFIKRFILCSGSLKALADEYGVSYPTLRIRLDRLMEKVRLMESMSDSDPFVTSIRLLTVNGDLSPATAKKILSSYKKHQKV